MDRSRRAGPQGREGRRMSSSTKRSPSPPTRTARTRQAPAFSRAQRPSLPPSRSKATPPLPCPSRPPTPSSRSNAPRLLSPQPARSSITAEAAPSIAARPTTFICRRARPLSAPPPAPPPRPITRPSLHELTHWAGIESRCNRQFGKRFGDDAYAIEELVAELGAAFLCADLGISDAPRADHAQYLDIMASRAEGRQEGDFHRRVEGVGGRGVSQRASGGISGPLPYVATTASAAPGAGSSQTATKHACMQTWDHELSQPWSHALRPNRRKAPALPRYAQVTPCPALHHSCRGFLL